MRCFDPAVRGEGRFTPQIGTLNGNPIAAAAGLATLQVLREPGTYDRLFATGERLISGLKEAFGKVGIPVRICGEPPVFDLFFTEKTITSYRDTLSNDKAQVARFNQQLLDRGIFRPDSKFYVSTVHSDEDLKCTLAAFTVAAEAI